MDKKRIILALLGIAVLVGALYGSIYLAMWMQEKAAEKEAQTIHLGSFSVEKHLQLYDVNIEAYMPEEGYENVGPVKDAETAIKKSKDLFVKYLRCTKKDLQEDYIFNEVYYDNQTGCWLVCGDLPEDTFGTEPAAIISTEGDVIAVWMK